jgi:pimeloyl-ACP methyl ester carboxylesterase
VTTLVFFHGWGAAGRVWGCQAAAFGSGLLVLAPDIPAWEAAWFRQYLAGLPLSQCVLVGWSLGGMLLAEALAGRRELRPAGLVLVGVAAAFCRKPDFPWGHPAAEVRALRRALAEDPPRARGIFAGNCLAPGEEDFRGEVETAFACPAHPENLAAGLDYLRRQDLRGSLAGLPEGTVLIQGGADRIVAASQAQHLKERLPGSRLHLLPDAGHLPFVTRAPAFNRILQQVVGCTLRSA